MGRPSHDDIGEVNHLLPLAEKNPPIERTAPSAAAGIKKRPRSWTYALVLAISTLSNVVLLFLLLHDRDASRPARSTHAGLRFDKAQTISHLGPYGLQNTNDTDRALLWEAMEVSQTIVAIDKDRASTAHLPPSQQFSWDPTKDVYSVRAFHSLHCLKKLHRWVAISHNNGTQLDHYTHVVHCLDALLADIHCYADDTLMRSTPISWGQGQTRQCRDWAKLQTWADAHNACFKYVNETQGVESMLTRYMWCPEASPYAETMREALRLPEDWDGGVPREMDSLPRYWEEFSNGGGGS